MEGNTEKTKVLCKQYLLEGDDDPTVAYNLMVLEYSLIDKPLPVKDIEDFKRYLED